MSTMPGLKMFFRQFDGKILKRFFEQHNEDFASEIEWEHKQPQLADEIYAALSGLREKNAESFRQIYATLSDIHLLSEKPKDAIYYRKKAFEIRGLPKKWGEQFKLGAPSVQTVAMWIGIEAPDLFKLLLARKFSSAKNASGGVRYYMPESYDGTIRQDLSTFRDDLKSYFKSEVGFPMRVHVERNDLPNCVRFVITTDPIPKYEQQYQDGGGDDDLDVGLSKRADCFYITLTEKTVRHSAQFKIRCEYTKAQRDQIAEYFAQDVLGSRRGVKTVQCRDLSAFKVRPKDFDIATKEPDYITHHYVGVMMEIASGGTKPEIYMRKFNGDLYDEIAKRGELRGVPEKDKTIIELYIEMEMYSGDLPEALQMNFLETSGVDDARKKKSYTVTVRAKGAWSASPSPLPVDERKIDRILRAMDIVDVAGEKALKTKTRK